MRQHKGVYREPRDFRSSRQVIQSYYDDVYLNKRGAIIFAVCRGKISEGLDFSDEAGRAVILIGIPYPMYYDPKTILKRAYLT